jgi:hypothetical protein
MPHAPQLIAGDLMLDAGTHTARRGERLLTLKPRAFALLHFFMGYPGQVFSREQLLQRLWDEPFIGDAARWMCMCAGFASRSRTMPASHSACTPSVTLDISRATYVRTRAAGLAGQAHLIATYHRRSSRDRAICWLSATATRLGR